MITTQLRSRTGRMPDTVSARGDEVPAPGPATEGVRVVRQPALPLWRHVVFVDWHGVLSRSPFWASIVTDPRHPLPRPLRARIGRLYGDAPLMAHWMTGRRRTPDVVAGLGVEGGARYGTDYLCRQLERDCRSMR